MLTAVHPKLPMRNKQITKQFYTTQLGFVPTGNDFEGYLMLKKDAIELHFFEFKDLIPNENYGQIYIRVAGIETVYNSLSGKQNLIHPNGNLAIKPWGQKEFSVLDPDNNLITFGEEVY